MNCICKTSKCTGCGACAAVLSLIHIYSPKIEKIGGVQVYRIRPRFTYRLFEWCEYHKQKKIEKLVRKTAEILNKLKLVLAFPFWPFISPLYARRFYREACRLHKQEPFDTVVAVYTPVDSLFAGHQLKKKFPELKFIPYFLDPLSGGWGPKQFSRKTVLKRNTRWESFLVSNADHIISMKSSWAHHEKNNADKPYFNKIIYLDIPLLRNEIQIADGKKNILYIGAIRYPCLLYTSRCV